MVVTRFDVMNYFVRVTCLGAFMGLLDSGHRSLLGGGHDQIAWRRFLASFCVSDGRHSKRGFLAPSLLCAEDSIRE